MGLRRKPGISLLVPTQNSEQTVELCIRSFVDFADEIIVVDNGSTDDTIDIVRRLERQIPKLTFYNVPELPDLYQNRQCALERSHYNWIVRIDSDYVAYTSGPFDIKKLREKILTTRRSVRPIVYGITQVNLFRDFWHTTRPKETIGIGKNSASPVMTLSARIIQYFPGMRFERLERWEGVRFQRYLKRVQIEKPYWFHCQFKSDIDTFFRSERTNWRECGEYHKYPTLESYIRAIVVDKYGTPILEEACQIFMQRNILPYIVRYDAENYYPYPEMIHQAMAQAREA